MEPLEMGISTACLPREAMPEGMREAIGIGIKHCEVALRSDDDRSPGEWRRLVEGLGLNCWSFHVPFGSQLDLSSLDREIQKQALHSALSAIDLGASLGADVMVIHAGAEPVMPEEREERLRNAAENLKPIMDRCAIFNRKLAIELLPRTCPGNSVEELERLLKPLDPRLAGVCVDLNHGNLTTDLPTVIRALGAKVFTIHASDNDGEDERHWLPGQGIIDWPAAMASLQDIRYSGPFMYESSRDRNAEVITARRLLDNYETVIAPLIRRGGTSA